MKDDVSKVTDAEFVKLWISAYKQGIGLIGLVKNMNWSYVSASQRASSLRRAGVKLPTMKSPNQKRSSLETDTKSLNELIVKELGEDALNWRNR